MLVLVDREVGGKRADLVVADRPPYTIYRGRHPPGMMMEWPNHRTAYDVHPSNHSRYKFC